MARFNKEQILTNVLPHVPVGLFNGWIMDDPATGILLGFGFLFYELMDKRENQDQAAPAILGWLIGLGMFVGVRQICGYL